MGIIYCCKFGVIKAFSMNDKINHNNKFCLLVKQLIKKTQYNQKVFRINDSELT